MKTGKPKLGLRISLCNEDGTLNEDPDMIRLFLDKVEPIDLGLIVIQFFETQLEEQEKEVFLLKWEQLRNNYGGKSAVFLYVFNENNTCGPSWP